MRRFFLSALFLLIVQQNPLAQTSEMNFIQRIDSSLSMLVELQMKVQDIHPCLKEFYPIAIPYYDSLLIFDVDASESKYSFIKETAQPFPLPEGIQSSFPLPGYDNKPTCVITSKTFDTIAGYATIMHEFIHCCQYDKIEPELKQQLEIYRNAIKNKDYSWEIMHNFPYNDSLFINYYDNYKKALEEANISNAKVFRQKIKEHLRKTDFEYLIWEEWKEGLARYVENKIHGRLKIEPNNFGKDKPYNRVSFYYSGELLIAKLAEGNRKLPSDMKSLFEKMRDF